MADQIERTCRYGHGRIVRVPHAWTVSQVEIAADPQALPRLKATGAYFLMSLYRCPRCGYLEFADDEEVAHGPGASTT